MAKTYSEAPDDCREIVNQVAQKTYPELLKFGVKIDLLSVATDGEEPALKLHGYPCAAVIRVVGLKERAKGHGDVEITIDEEVWHTSDTAQQRALIDHELRHIALKMDPKNEKQVKLDSAGRPKIGMHKHDLQVGWFRDIAERHGDASFEVQQARTAFLIYRQTFFAFVGEPTIEPPEKVRALAEKIKRLSPSGQALVMQVIDAKQEAAP